MVTTTAEEFASQQDQRVLKVYHLYRCLLGLILTLAAFTPLGPEIFEEHLIDAVRVYCGVYLLLNLGILLAPPFGTQGQFVVTATDILMLAGLMYLTGANNLGISNLLFVSVAAGNILIHGQAGIALAALASICVTALAMHMGLQATGMEHQVNSWLLGIMFFVTAILIQGLARRLRHTEMLAQENARHNALLQALSHNVIRHMKTGILVVREPHEIIMINESAQRLLGDNDSNDLSQLSPQLHQALEQWQTNPSLHPAPFRIKPDANEIKAGFSSLGSDGFILIFLDDIALLAQQAQQLKLASLGRLSASIAHEIRNPLGAISHAAQLMHEDISGNNSESRLLRIILDQSNRVNKIIENVQQLSRRRQPNPELIQMNQWLQQFIDSEYARRKDVLVKLHPCDHDVWVNADATQMTQVVRNLCDNGLYYSREHGGQAYVILTTGVDQKNGQPWLDIRDYGPGLTSEQETHLFEPFYTTSKQGTGLGLYLARELCEANQASLHLASANRLPGACFRITFAHPDRLMS
ncbi:sensor histidine kinase [Spongorhabdus nitratireducens]